MNPIRYLHAFLFAPTDPRRLALLRIGIGTLTVIYLIELFPLAGVHFSGDGWLGDSELSYPYGWSLLNGNSSARAAGIFFLFATASALMFTLGYRTRLSAWLTFVALVSIWNRDPLILDGDDAVLRITIFYVALSPCGNAWSLDARTQVPQHAEAWPLRLLQFQLALIYFVSGWAKFHSEHWLDGSILQYVAVHPQYARSDLSACLAGEPGRMLLAVLAHVIRWWELLFPALLLHPYTRAAALLMGVAFHLGLMLFMSLRWFPQLMLVLYIAFIPDRFLPPGGAGGRLHRFR